MATAVRSRPIPCACGAGTDGACLCREHPVYLRVATRWELLALQLPWYIYIIPYRVPRHVSPRGTLAHGSDVHFYHEVFDQDHVYPELHRPGTAPVTVPIALLCGERSVILRGAKPDPVDKQDEVLLAMVEQDVDERLAKMQGSAARLAPRASLAWDGWAVWPVDLVKRKICKGATACEICAYRRQQLREQTLEVTPRKARRALGPVPPRTLTRLKRRLQARRHEIIHRRSPLVHEPLA